MAGRLQERCSGCGAAVGVEALACEYCGAPSPHALRAKSAASEADLAQAEARVQRTEDEIRRGGTTALVAATVGVVTCCLPIGAVLGLIFAQRARRQAKEAGLVAPATATVALILGGLGLAAFLGFAVLVALEIRKEQQRTAELHALVDEAAAQNELTQPVACGLAELRLIQDGWDGHSGNSVFESMECPGRVTIDGTSAVLEGIVIRPRQGERVQLSACFDRGARWFVRALVPADFGCGEHPGSQPPPAE